MKRNIKHELVNWIDGMKISKVHFQQTEDYFLDSLCDARAIRLTNTNYGLLPFSNSNEGSSEIEISERVTNKVEIKLRRCNAITAGGCRISYNPEPSEYMILTHSFDTDKDEDAHQSRYWDVILSVNPYKRVPTGIPDEEENPPRHPYVATSYQLSFMPKGEIISDRLGLHHLVIGRIRQNGGRYEVDTNFIPPCTSMSSHPDLMHYYDRFGMLLNEIERTSKVIINKVQNKSHNSSIALHINSICRDIMRYIATIYFSYRNLGHEYTPVEVVNYFSTLAHTCYISLSFIGKNEKEELLKYFYEWSDVTPGSFEELLSNTLNIIYEHNNIRPVMTQVESFLQMFSELWIKLSMLEYIGQHKENIVVSERAQQQEGPKTKGGWTILD